ncbi:ferredoxin [Reticulibacter mediterranei]|uniref:Ferredoxin n=1 Tax=Reticulibacter mediterranei TaxID=2778369 RepID=A0A8J3N1L3_9CHLR|nr:ferredoxin [Reticulibacter mediterranei]GHO92320.1 ferredoxin [Reticulibacter mediterranei]
MRIVVSTDKCVASGSCALASPQIFTQRESDGVVHVLNMHLSQNILQKMREVVDACPAQAFTIEDEENTAEITLVEEGEA